MDKDARKKMVKLADEILLDRLQELKQKQKLCSLSESERETLRFVYERRAP